MKNLLRFALLTFIIFAITALPGCEKDDNNNNTEKIALLTAHTWNLDKLSTTSTHPDIQQMVKTYDVMLANATLNFATDGTYTHTVVGATENETWKFNEDGTVLFIGDDAMFLINLTNDVLEYTQGMQAFNLTYVLTWKWVK